MWRMLTSRSKDLEIELVEHDDASAHWLAHYTFSTGRHVDNDVRARFSFDDEGLIVEHCDEFDFHPGRARRSGTSGLLLGWTPIVQGARAQARRARGWTSSAAKALVRRRRSARALRTPAAPRAARRCRPPAGRSRPAR